ncbi:formylmethanofuran--tetrahydromethanopterin N-formyltransferase [Crateriforma conspicua]|uniref:Formylmethanofuran--tetrahydromethanopterin formyltransferase n=1 Tax=Crateriforma conspicua TaxID=2527996 RepID=A0A5C6FK65_9PLAN|nr:formylmethanofuran--tetrahydromethanopterin N-formyltransferase [Crateriforma conspicua]TWU62675.1 Formyltransferase/hydrolase complex subunit D [Crateriforma conspicua]
MQINGVTIDDTFAEAFDMKATRLVVTGQDPWWVSRACDALTGFGTSVIACGVEIDVEQTLAPDQTPDGRPGAMVLAFAASGTELRKHIPTRCGQCVLTCPTTAVFDGTGDLSVPVHRDDPVPLGKSLRFFGDGHQISKSIDAVRYWRIPVMDGEFVCQHDLGWFSGIGGGNFLLCGDSVAVVADACRAATEAIASVPGVITPFPGGATRSGSKVGSKYDALFASTNEAFCPTLRHLPQSQIDAQTHAVLEVVIDGVNHASIANATRVGILAAAKKCGSQGLHRITAGNYGGKLGKHHFHLHALLSEPAVSSDSSAEDASS